MAGVSADVWPNLCLKIRACDTLGLAVCMYVESCNSVILQSLALPYRISLQLSLHVLLSRISIHKLH